MGLTDDPLHKGYGLSWSTRACTARCDRRFPPTESHRTLRDGSFLGHIPGSKLPGYLHLVPSGQQTIPTGVHIFESTSFGLQKQAPCSEAMSIQRVERLFEDEDDDEGRVRFSAFYRPKNLLT
jgi:hypothetical protein